jgi:type IV secretory pathway VirB2 component (pilin)
MSIRERLRWLAVPIAAYLVITLALPIANGAAGREDFLVHAATVLGGCAVVVVAIVAFGAACEIAVAGVRRLANNRRTRRVVPTGGNS